MDPWFPYRWNNARQAICAFRPDRDLRAHAGLQVTVATLATDCELVRGTAAGNHAGYRVDMASIVLEVEP